MQVSRRKTSLILCAALLTFFSITITARADDDDEDDYDVKARVVRISLIGGEVNLKRNGNQDWEPLRLNYPLVEGDTVETNDDSRLEIQIDARNFVRLAANSTLRIVTLRDEGIALSVVEGTAVVRLRKFDRKHEYFELDAPRTTMAAEKEGSYRIDVPRDGRVRLTVRDGGSARIYSDTSGFALRDGRTAELIATGENMGDWEFSAISTRDAIDDWVSEREQYLAQRLKYDVKYYDEYVWGGEDLDAYGDWSYADDFGWIWRPHPTTISTFTDWAPYRYGHWSWCPPYGWTWVGYEPWGWAPYHYGRWVYHNGYWAWCPRSQFYRTRSWWRPALVAFVFDISFGNDVCWYPLSYYQRDPRSRHYRHDRRDNRDARNDRHDRPGYINPGGRRDRRDDGPWRGVTRMPRRDFGNPDRRGRGVDEIAGRRVIDREPGVVTPPGRGGVAENVPNSSGRPERRFPRREIPDRPTGAADRAPGASLDEDLRRTRIFRGREPRRDGLQPTNTAGNPRTETRPSGAVNRPESAAPNANAPRPEMPASPDQPRDGRPSRGNRRNPESGERTTPRNVPDAGNTPEPPRTEQPATTPAPEPRTEPRPERPRFEPRPDSGDRPARRPERRSEDPRPENQPSRPDSPRIDPPRTESPRTESPRPERHPEPRSEPRSESPRSEPRPAPRTESPRSESPRNESPRSESPRSEPPRSSPPPRSDPPARSESPKNDSRTDRMKPDKPML